MKKLLLTVALAVATVGAAFAQQGQMAAGINLGVAPCIESGEAPTNFQLGAKFQYGITDDIRGELDLEYGFKSKNTSVFDITANFHYLVPITDKIKIYPVVGLGWASVKFHTPKELSSALNSYQNMLGNILGGYGSYDDFDEEDLDDYLESLGGKGSNSSKGSSSSSASRFVFNIGVGGEYDLTDNLSLNLEIKYQYMKDFNRMPITLGVAYKF